MAEVLTESFCERCGTRYTFESSRSRAKRLKGVKVLSRGLKNFVLSDDSSLDEAMAAARSDTEREVSSQQLDAFHKTFNFCMTCRQYTCANCWNEVDGTCLTCSPHLGHEILPAPFPDLDPSLGMTVEIGATDLSNGNGSAGTHGTNGNGHAASALDAGAWPTSDLLELEGDQHASGPSGPDEIDAVARLAALTAIGTSKKGPAETVEVPVEVEAAAAAETVEVPVEVEAAAAETVEVPVEVEAAAAETVEVEAAVEHRTPAHHVAAATAAQTAALMHRFRPGQNLDAEIEAYERDAAAAGSARVVAAELEAEPIVGADSVVADEPVEQVVASPEIDHAREEAAAAAAAAAVSVARPTDVIAQPTWRIVAPDGEPAPQVVIPATPVAPVPPVPVATVVPPTEWPAQPEWPSQRPSAGLPFLGRLNQPSGGLDSLWAESNREVASAAPTTGRPAQGGVQPCVSCGLSLSATARFCRRCGSSQAV